LLALTNLTIFRINTLVCPYVFLKINVLLYDKLFHFGAIFNVEFICWQNCDFTSEVDILTIYFLFYTRQVDVCFCCTFCRLNFKTLFVLNLNCDRLNFNHAFGNYDRIFCTEIACTNRQVIVFLVYTTDEISYSLKIVLSLFSFNFIVGFLYLFIEGLIFLSPIFM